MPSWRSTALTTLQGDARVSSPENAVWTTDNVGGRMTVDNIVIVSGDGHATPLVPDIIGYLEPAYRIFIDDLIREDVAYIGSRATPARPPRLTIPMFDERGLVRSGGEFGACNALPDLNGTLALSR